MPDNEMPKSPFAKYICLRLKNKNRSGITSA